MTVHLTTPIVSKPIVNNSGLIVDIKVYPPPKQ